MKRSRTYVALFLVYLFVPGAHEVTENLFHIVAYGDLAHQVQDADHHEADAEHDCSGLFHSCLCHASVLVTVPAASVTLAAHPPRRGDPHGHDTDRLATGYPDTLYRPPIA